MLSKLLAAMNALHQVPAKEGCAESLEFLSFFLPAHCGVSCWDPDTVRSCVVNWLAGGTEFLLGGARSVAIELLKSWCSSVLTMLL